MYKIGLSPIVTWDEAQYVFQTRIQFKVAWLTDIQLWQIRLTLPQTRILL